MGQIGTRHGEHWDTCVGEINYLLFTSFHIISFHKVITKNSILIYKLDFFKSTTISLNDLSTETPTMCIWNFTSCKQRNQLLGTLVASLHDPCHLMTLALEAGWQCLQDPLDRCQAYLGKRRRGHLPGVSRIALATCHPQWGYQVSHQFCDAESGDDVLRRLDGRVVGSTLQPDYAEVLLLLPPKSIVTSVPTSMSFRANRHRCGLHQVLWLWPLRFCHHLRASPIVLCRAICHLRRHWIIENRRRRHQLNQHSAIMIRLLFIKLWVV